jgi:hypothetical protein
MRPASASAFPCLVIAVDEAIPLFTGLVPYLSPDCNTYLAGSADECAVALLLDRHAAPQQPRIRAVGPTALGLKKPDGLGAELAALFDGLAEAVTVLPSAGCRSFVSAPLFAAERLTAGAPGRYISVTFSPSSKACAAIELAL